MEELLAWGESRAKQIIAKIPDGSYEFHDYIELDITGLGSVYLGEFSFADLVRASRAQELTKGAVARADALFATDTAPWCVEIF